MVYRPLFQRLDALPRGQVRALDERLEATMREMGVTFDIARERPWGRRPWFCDVLPQIFTPEEWEPLERGIRQRLRAFELFLCDIYGKKEILRANLLPDPADSGEHSLPACGGQSYAAWRRLPASQRTKSLPCSERGICREAALLQQRLRASPT